MKTLQLGQTYPTRDGKGSGRVVRDDLLPPMKYGVVVAGNSGKSKSLLAYGELGYFLPPGEGEHPMDLIIPERKMRTVWLNVYPASLGAVLVYNSLAAAKANANPDVIAIAYPVEVPAE